MLETLYWGVYRYKEWTFHLTAGEHGVCHIALPNDGFDSTLTWVKRYAGGATLTQNESYIEPYKRALQNYLSGESGTFDIPIHLRGTDFQRAVWNALCTIPLGQTRSYSEVSEDILRPRAVRAVGAAIGANPIPLIVPCHRVIGKWGHLTGFRGGLPLKEWLLEHEIRLSAEQCLQQ